MDHQALAQLLGNYGEFIGSIAVVVTLGYLAIQIRQSTVVARSAVRQGITEMTVYQVSDLVTNRDVAKRFMDAIVGREVDELDSFQLQARCYIEFRRFENIHYQYRNGMFDDSEFYAEKSTWKSLINRNKAFARNWCSTRQNYSPEFAAEINNMLADDVCVATQVE